MAEVENLEWEVSKNKDWITVYPESGVGNAQVNINVQPTQIVGDTDTAGTVTFTCKSCSPQLLKQVSVTRCAPTECVPESRNTVYADTAVTANACDSSVSVSLTYSEITKYKGGAAVNCPDKIINGSMTTSFIINTNDTNMPITYTRYYPDVNTQGHATITISQSAGPCSCVDYDVSASTTSLSCGGGNISFKAVRAGSRSRGIKERWVNTDGYICVGYDKYNKIKKQISTDNGVTWIDEGSLKAGDNLLERNSSDCGYVPPTPPPTPPTPPTPPAPGEDYRWIDDGYMCVSFDKYMRVKKQKTTDGGATWIDVIPKEYSATTLVEANSPDCVNAIISVNEQEYLVPHNTETLIGGDIINVYPNLNEITSVEITKNVRSIGVSALENCTNLDYIKIIGEPKILGQNAFHNTNNCPILVQISYITNYLSSNEWSEYFNRIQTILGANKKALFIIDVPNDDFIELNCNSSSVLTKAEVDNSIGSQNSIYRVEICDCTTSIEANAFARHYEIESVFISRTVSTVGSSAFHLCSGMTNLFISEGVEEIGGDAFSYCSGLTSVIIPSTIKKININAFSNCGNLNSVIINAVNPPEFGINAFDRTNSCPIYVPSESVDAYKTAENLTKYASRIQPIA